MTLANRLALFVSAALLVSGCKDQKAESPEPAEKPSETAKPSEPAPTPTATDAKPAPSEKPARVETLPPTQPKELFDYLKASVYREWAEFESKAHPSKGPHTRRGMPVRVYINQIQAKSLEAGNKVHPKGSALVKEMFTEKNELRGWAVMVKTADETGDDGEGWYWYEVTSVTSGDNPVADGNGVGLCASCHDSGTDMVLTDYPLK